MTNIHLTINDITYTIDNYNNDFLLLKSTKNTALSVLGTAIFQANFDFVEEVIVTEVEICIQLNDAFTPSKLTQFQTLSTPSKLKKRHFKLPVYFNEHADWQEVLSITNFTKSQIIHKIICPTYTIAMFAFLPGFTYLKGLDHDLYIPRKKVPSKYIKANSIAVGGKYLGIYALPSPGGWHVIGHTPISIFQISQLPPVTLSLGDHLQIVSIDKVEYEHLLNNPISLIDYNQSHA